jgi:hypothetical protein
VTFLDVLGQREQFRELRLPKNAEEEAQVKVVLSKSAGFVASLREVFQTQFVVAEEKRMVSESNPELVAGYGLLREYFLSRACDFGDLT